MATFQIPVRRDRFNYSIQIEIESKLFTLYFKYNARTDSWFMDIGGAVKGVHITGGVNILKPHDNSDEVPSGSFDVLDLDGLGRRPNKTTFGDRVILTYTEP